MDFVKTALHGYMGRKRFNSIYFTALVLKWIMAALICISLSAFSGLGMARILLLLIGVPAVWLFIDICLLPSYAARLNDVALSRYCLIPMYVGNLCWLMLFFVIGQPASPVAQPDMEWFLNPAIFMPFSILSLLWIAGMILRVFLIFKRSEDHAVA